MKMTEPIPPPWNPEASLQQSAEKWAVAVRSEVVIFKVTQAEVRALVGGAGLLGVRTAVLLAWAGTVNPTDVTLPRWRRPFVQEETLIRYVASLDARALEVARELARRFDIDVESHLLARTFHWLRRIRSVHLDDARWQRLEIPAARVPWTQGIPDDDASRW